MKNLFVVAIACALVMASCHTAFAGSQPSGGLKAVDLIFVRPVSLAVAIGSTLTLAGISLPVYLVGMGKPAIEIMVKAPWRFTNARPLGAFGHYKDNRPIMEIPDNI
ncbi:MAG: hypothetical protein RBT11_01820 [Desulfobacterales bacterium]|jgi:hypothetical protein|nr:hypothetical protein [Desulfobacterales bacterium]